LSGLRLLFAAISTFYFGSADLRRRLLHLIPIENLLFG